jgi:hypothetical protein
MLTIIIYNEKNKAGFFFFFFSGKREVAQFMCVCVCALWLGLLLKCRTWSEQLWFLQSQKKRKNMDFVDYFYMIYRVTKHGTIQVYINNHQDAV